MQNPGRSFVDGRAHWLLAGAGAAGLALGGACTAASPAPTGQQAIDAAVSQGVPSTSPELESDAASDAASGAHEAAVLEAGVSVPGMNDAAQPPVVADAGSATDDSLVGACGPFARLLGSVGFGDAACGGPTSWVSPTFVYEDQRSSEPSLAVAVKDGDGVVVSARFPGQDGATTRTVFARVDERGDCQELIGYVDDDDPHYVIAAQTDGQNTVLLTSCGTHLCSPQLRKKDRPPYALLSDLALESPLDPSSAQVHHEFALTHDGGVVAVTSVRIPVESAMLWERIFARLLSPELQLTLHETLPVGGRFEDLALTDADEPLVLVSLPSQALSHHLIRLSTDLREFDEVYVALRASAQDNPVEVGFGRIALSVGDLVVLDANTFTEQPFAPTSVATQSPRNNALSLWENGLLLHATPASVTLYGPDAAVRWSYTLDTSVIDRSARVSRAVVQRQTSGRILASFPWQLVGLCEP